MPKITVLGGLISAQLLTCFRVEELRLAKYFWPLSDPWEWISDILLVGSAERSGHAELSVSLLFLGLPTCGEGAVSEARCQVLR